MPQTRFPIAVAALVVLVLGGCAENRASFFIELVKVPSAECDVESSESGYYRTAGVLDVAYSREYFFTPLLANQLASRGSAEELIAETNGIQVEGANVRIWQGGRPQGSAFYAFYQPASSYVHPEDVTATGFVAIPDAATQALLTYRFPEFDPANIPVDSMLGYRDLVTIGVQMLGTTNGNAEVETPEFYFTVQICFGCLTFCPPDSVGEGSSSPCTSEEPPEETPCWIGQDEGVDCRICNPYYGQDRCRDFCGS